MSSLRSLVARARRAGLVGLARAVARRVRPQRATALPHVAAAVRGARGLEIGGPSGMFRASGALPVYDVVGALDNCNFGAVTTWEGSIEEGETFEFRRGARGRQFIREASELHGLPDGAYDFVLSSHTLEHLADPLRALREWARVLRPGGALVLLVPHREATFDRRRPVTTLEHLREDEARGTGEDDATHLPEILELHDLALDPGAGSRAAFEARCADNVGNRCVHHHVFDTELAVRVVDAAGFRIEVVEAFRPHHILVLARSPAGAGARADNARHLAPAAPWRAASPFAGDRRSAASRTAGSA